VVLVLVNEGQTVVNAVNCACWVGLGVQHGPYKSTEHSVLMNTGMVCIGLRLVPSEVVMILMQVTCLNATYTVQRAACK